MTSPVCLPVLKHYILLLRVQGSSSKKLKTIFSSHGHSRQDNCEGESLKVWIIGVFLCLLEIHIVCSFLAPLLQVYDI